jgi:hypothetical protein
MVGEIIMNIQEEMDRIFKMQQDNLANERKFKELADAERKSLEDEEIKFMWLNYYECPECENIWEDQWDCQVDDDCSECGCRHISPSNSTEIEEVAK